MRYDPQHSQAEVHIAMFVFADTGIQHVSMHCDVLLSSFFRRIVIVAIVAFEPQSETYSHLSSPAAVDIIGTQCDNISSGNGEKGKLRNRK